MSDAAESTPPPPPGDAPKPDAEREAHFDAKYGESATPVEYRWFAAGWDAARATAPPSAPTGEPVAWATYDADGCRWGIHWHRDKADAECAELNGTAGQDERKPWRVVPLYASPPPPSREATATATAVDGEAAVLADDAEWCLALMEQQHKPVSVGGEEWDAAIIQTRESIRDLRAVLARLGGGR